MGGYNCGGRNQTHGCTASHKRLDSFYFGKCIPLLEQQSREFVEHTMRWNDGGNIGVALYLDRLMVGYSVTQESGQREKVRTAIHFDSVPNNYGGSQRYYFLCPHCGRRCRLLYLHRLHFKCRQCAGLNYPSQQATKGTHETSQRLIKFLREKFGVEESLSPHEASYYWPARPKGMHYKTYDRLRIELEQLQEQYNEAFISHCINVLGITL